MIDLSERVPPQDAVAAGKISGRVSAEKRSQAMNKKYNGQKGKP